MKKTKKVRAKIKQEAPKERFVSTLKCSACKEPFDGIQDVLVMGDIILCPECITELCMELIEIMGGSPFEDEEESTVKTKSKNQSNPNKKLKEISAKTLLAKVLKDVKGQDDKVEHLISILDRNFSYNNKEFKSNIIIIGKTGTGKTKTLEKIFQILDKPYVIANSTQYTKTGWVGRDVSSIITNLINKAGGNIEEASKGVVILDEFDKLLAAGVSDREGVSRGAQEELLKIIEGTTMDITFSDDTVRQIDTGNITFVGVGAFPELYEIRRKRLSKKSIGFSTVSESSVPQVNSPFTLEDLEEFGAMAELIGRMPCIIEWNSLDLENLKDIMLNSESSQLRHMERYLNSKNIELVMEDGTIDEMAKKAKSFDTGARSIKKVIDDTFLEIDKMITYSFEKSKKKHKLYISSETVKDPTKFKIE